MLDVNINEYIAEMSAQVGQLVSENTIIKLQVNAYAQELSKYKERFGELKEEVE